VNEGQRRLAERRASVEKEVREIEKGSTWASSSSSSSSSRSSRSRVGVGVIALLKEENRRKFHRKTKEKVVSNLFVFALSHPPAGLKRRSSLPR
jgi:hypothetical protein